jgi:Concanavalin A-like lectin/glucanases superfamily
MNKHSRTTPRNTRYAIRQPWLLSLILLSGLLLAACDTVPNEPTITGGGGGGNPAASYTGQACNAVSTDPNVVEDICNFQTEFWTKMLDASDCENCHNTDTASQQPYFMDTADVNTAYSQMISPTLNNLPNLIDRNTPANSGIISKISGGHNCGTPTACNTLATNASTYLTNWVNGGVAGSGAGAQGNTVTLTAPTIKSTGTSKNFPDPANPAPAGFAGVHTLLTQNCSNCHRDSAPVPQTPFFADSDIDAAYNAVVASQKISLDIPRDSRLVVRLDEGHNCWDLSSTSQQAITEGRKNCAVLMEQAISAFSGTIGLTAVDSSWVTSKALTLLDGTVASGGARDDSSTIALYEFKAGSGATIQDSSGVGAPLNLTLYGTEGTDYRWVGGWGVEFLTGNSKAQASTQGSRKLLTSILGSGEYSIEAWVVPANISQGDNNPARIINYSGGSTERNFTLGQAEYRYAFMNRSSAEPSPNGNTLLTDDMDEDLQSTQQHVVVTFDLVNGRKVFVNGVDVATIGNDIGLPDPLIPAGSLTGWDPTYAFSMGNEADFSEPWEGKLRMVAIHNRAMSPTQVQQNFEAGVGQKFFLMFSVSDQMGDPNCFLDSAKTTDNPNGDQCFVYFVASQFDTYSYLFTQPTFVSLNPAFTPSGTTIKGIRVGMNGKEPAVGQAYISINTTINSTDFDASTGQQVLSNMGTIFSLEKGAGSDEFFLTFEELGATNTNIRIPAICGGSLTCTTTPVDGSQVPVAGLRTFEEILASMSVMTGVDPYLSQFSSVLETYYKEDSQGVVTGIKQQLPSTENIGGFLAAHEMAVAQLAIAYCNALVEDATLRDNFFGTSPSFAFTSNVATAFPSITEKNQIVDALYDKMVGIGGIPLTNMPSSTEIRTELVGPNDATAIAGGHPGNLFGRLETIMVQTCSSSDPMINVKCDNSDTRTRAVVKALCASVLGSAAMIVQ